MTWTGMATDEGACTPELIDLMIRLDRAIKARKTMISEQYDIVILDEINVTIWFDLLSVKQVLKFLDECPENVEIILPDRLAYARR